LQQKNQEEETKKMKGEGKERYQRLTEPRIAAGEEVKSKRKKNARKNRRGIFARLLLLVLDEHKLFLRSSWRRENQKSWM